MNRAAVGILGILAVALLVIPIAVAEQGQIAIPLFGRVTVLTLDLKKGDIVDFSWSSNSSVTFRVENLTGDNFVNRSGQTGSGNWEAPADGTYTFQFRNNNFSVAQVQWTIDRRGVVPLTMIYFIVGFVAIAVAATAVYAIRKHHPAN